MLAATEADHEATLEYVRRAVGKTDAPLHSYFALVADDPSVQIVSIAQKWYVEQLLQGTPDEGLPVLSAAAPFKAGGRGGLASLKRMHQWTQLAYQVRRNQWTQPG